LPAYLLTDWRVGHIVSTQSFRYEVATISRPLKIISLFCRISLYGTLALAKDTCNFKESTNRSHPIGRQRCGTSLGSYAIR